MKLTVLRLQALHREDRSIPDAVCQGRAGVDRCAIDEHGTRATLRSVAAQLGPRETQLVAQRGGQRFVRQNVDPSCLAVDGQSQKPLRAGGLGRSGTRSEV